MIGNLHRVLVSLAPLFNLLIMLYGLYSLLFVSIQGGVVAFALGLIAAILYEAHTT